MAYGDSQVEGGGGWQHLVWHFMGGATDIGGRGICFEIGVNTHKYTYRKRHCDYIKCEIHVDRQAEGEGG